jgi:heme exporter protein B
VPARLVATPGVAATGTLFGSMTVRTQARDLLLAVVLFPLLAPTLLTAVVATRELFGGVALSELGDYFLLMGVFDLVFIAGGVALFGTLIER